MEAAFNKGLIFIAVIIMFQKKHIITKTFYTQQFMISNFVIVNNIRNTYRFLQPTIYDLKLWNSKQYKQYHFRMLWQPNEPTNEQISDLMKEKDLAAIQIKSAGMLLSLSCFIFRHIFSS
jgi:hypothetical protein